MMGSSLDHLWGSEPKTSLHVVESAQGLAYVAGRILLDGREDNRRLAPNQNLYLPLIFIVLASLVCACLPRFLCYILGRFCGSGRFQCDWTWTHNDGTWCYCLPRFLRRRSRPRDDMEMHHQQGHVDRMRRFAAPEGDGRLPAEALDGFFRHGVLEGNLSEGGVHPAPFVSRGGSADGTLPVHALDGLVRHRGLAGSGPGQSAPPRRLGDAPGLREAYRQMNSARLSVETLSPEPLNWYTMLSEEEKRMVVERALMCEPYSAVGNKGETHAGDASTSTAANTASDQSSKLDRIDTDSSDSGDTAKAVPIDATEESLMQTSVPSPNKDEFENETFSGEEADSSARICAICLGEFEKGQLVNCPTKCPHIFHRDCLIPWLVKHGQCPCCRATLLDGHDWGRGAMRLSIRGGAGSLGSMLSESIRIASQRVRQDLAEEEETQYAEESNNMELASQYSDDNDLVEVDIGDNVDSSGEENQDLEITQHGEWTSTTESEAESGAQMVTLTTTVIFGELSSTDIDDLEDSDAELVDIELGTG
mmetsp:Transcript_29802/g.88442  ORF Transcript_29802/g.88442 Transcript_29802/m.88442 type:complete len:535 (+) Transcript_29802:306-1910(+)